MKKLITLLALALVFSYISITQLNSGPVKPPLGYTGAPGESYCTDCHSGTPVNGGGGYMTLAFNGVNNQYVPGHKYTITVTVVDAVQSPLCGFETVILNSNNNSIGKMKLITPDNTIIRTSKVNGRTYITNYQGDPYSQWKFKWTAPVLNVGPITIYSTGNASNDDFTPQGDHIYSTTLTLNPGSMKVGDSYDELFSVYPTVVTHQFTANYSLMNDGPVEITLYNMNGQIQEKLLNETLEAGQYHDSFVLRNHYTPGMYVVVLEKDGESELQKIILQ